METNRLSLERILQTVCATANIGESALRSGMRSTNIINARIIFAHCAAEQHYTLQEIADTLHKDRSTVSYYKSVFDCYRHETGFAELLEKVCNALKPKEGSFADVFADTIQRLNEWTESGKDRVSMIVGGGADEKGGRVIAKGSKSLLLALIYGWMRHEGLLEDFANVAHLMSEDGSVTTKSNKS